MLYPKGRRTRVRKQSPAEVRAVYEAVMERDRSCVALRIDPAAGECSGRLTREHVRPGGGAMGAPRVTRRDTVLILCHWHHLGSGWATSHKSEERAYLARMEGQG